MAIPTIDEVQARERPDPSTWASLAQRDDETKRAHIAFVDYALMGPGRSLRQLHARYRRALRDRVQTGIEPGTEKPPTRRLSTLGEWSARFDWQQRIEAWTAELKQADQVLWEERRRAIREADFEAGEALRNLAADILQETPQFLKTTRRFVKGGEGLPDREVITVGIDIGAMLKALAQASDLQRQAAGMPKVLDVTSGGEPLKYYEAWTPGGWDDEGPGDPNGEPTPDH